EAGFIAEADLAITAADFRKHLHEYTADAITLGVTHPTRPSPPGRFIIEQFAHQQCCAGRATAGGERHDADEHGDPDCCCCCHLTLQGLHDCIPYRIQTCHGLPGSIPLI